MINKMKEIIGRLNEASLQYYKYNNSIMDNREYDKLLDQLEAMEKKTGIILSNSPTQNVQGEMLDELKKVKHVKPMLSADKTKDVNEVAKFLGDEEGVLSWKLDGLTIVVTYNNGEFKQAVTRGGGEIGEDVTHTIRNCINLPLTIPYKGELVVRGECTISYDNFNKINKSIQDIESKYKNPRNLASGSVRQLDSKVASERYLEFKAFAIVKCDREFTRKNRQFEFLVYQGIDVVEYKLVYNYNILESIKEFDPAHYGTPVDGLVVEYNDIAYGESLGATGHHTLNMIALKWEDELVETTFRGVELKTSRYGVVSITALFDSVEIDGTTVSRASLHNVDIFNQLQLGIGDTVQVYKANMIIPQIYDNLTRSGSYQLPMVCPSCSNRLEVIKRVETNELHCNNDDCTSKLIQRLNHFVSKEAMNIEGLSEATLEKFVTLGLIGAFKDIYLLEQHEQQIMTMEGFGKKSYANLINSINKSKDTSLDRLIYSLGIRNVGRDASKKISNQCKGKIETFDKLIKSHFDWSSLDGIGDIINQSIQSYFNDDKHFSDFLELSELVNVLHIEETHSNNSSNMLAGKVFVVTGSVEHFKNRAELQTKIERLGGKCSGSVSSNTTYLINNDIASSSSKNTKAKSLGVNIITEQQFIDLVGGI